MGDVTPREEVSEEDKHKDKSSGRHLIFTTDKQTAGEGFLWADFLFFSSLFPPILISISCNWDDCWSSVEAEMYEVTAKEREEWKMYENPRPL